MTQPGQKTPEQAYFESQLDNVLAEIRSELISKNLAYGNSALKPIRVMSKATPVEQLLVRIDDKLSRISNGARDRDLEDAEFDMLGYLVLLMIARKA